MTRDEIMAEVSRTLVTLFEIDPEAVRPEARFYEDLDLDSIDAIDMAVHIQTLTGQRIEVDSLRKIRTVDDIVTHIEQMLQQPPA